MSRTEVDARSLRMAESFLDRARNKLQEAEKQLGEGHYPESVSASQECIEFSVKSVCEILSGRHPWDHWFPPEEFWKVLKHVPEELKDLAYSKLYFYHSFWYSLYSTVKYGLDGAALGPEKLFEKEEAQLSLKHADRCRFAAKQLENCVKRNQPEYATPQRKVI
nr:HEPN domain-containing protein [Candidatus Njordarchaeota archaeon]